MVASFIQKGSDERKGGCCSGGSCRGMQAVGVLVEAQLTDVCADRDRNCGIIGS